MSSSAESDGYNDLETAIRVLTERPSAQRIARIAQDNAQLRDANKKLTEENKTFPDLCKRFMHEAEQAKRELDSTTDELENLRKEKQAADAKLADKSKSLDKSIQQIVALEAQHEEGRRKMEKDLKRKTSELDRLRTCFLDLNVTPGPESLGDIFKSLRVAARDLASTFFGYHLPTEVLAQSGDWTKISEHHSKDSPIPLLLANSLLAKQTRTALVISVLGFELCQHIFQPTYLNEYPGVNKLSTDLAGIDPYQECHLRSVLLKTTQAMCRPQGNPKAAAKAIITLLSPVVETSKRSSFEIDVHKLCQQALETWRDIQTWDILVVPNLGSSRAAKRRYRWQSFATPTPTKSTGKQRPNNPPSSPPPTPADETPIDLLTGTAVWPAFINLSVDPEDDDDDPTLAAGYILPASVISDAEKELAAAAASAAAAGPVSPTGYLHRELREVERGAGAGTGSGSGKRRRSSVVSGGSASSVVSASGGGGGGTGNGKKEVGFLVNGQGAGSKGG
ncbi:uncharacterized protein C8A04DRAFT_13582 [Dichotomopilus funicola]|uniref:Uncharacterized protein n=1 Tax=Dichotomopilus funicola TaxID=1934379 RepID=A0AAN6V0S7_9PEZI|nr:hypothetical protein C8A04DRAFT_13582 [Dichotomopilus funicola]